jgi:hypothetical protein
MKTNKIQLFDFPSLLLAGRPGWRELRRDLGLPTFMMLEMEAQQ